MSSLVPSTVSLPIFKMHCCTVVQEGICKSELTWVYSRRHWNSGLSTSSNGWSQAIIHSMSSFSNSAWSQLFFCIRLSEEKSEGMCRLHTVFAIAWHWKSWSRLLEAFSSWTSYWSVVSGSKVCLPWATASSSFVGGEPRSFKNVKSLYIGGKWTRRCWVHGAIPGLCTKVNPWFTVKRRWLQGPAPANHLP